jgi:hypothetical protein
VWGEDKGAGERPELCALVGAEETGETDPSSWPASSALGKGRRRREVEAAEGCLEQAKEQRAWRLRSHGARLSELAARCGGAALHGEDEMRPEKYSRTLRGDSSTRKKKEKTRKLLETMAGGVHV